MVISKRERYIGIGVAAAVALLVVDHFVWTPYNDRSIAVMTQLADIKIKEANADTTFNTKRTLQKDWDAMRKTMKTDSSEAESQARSVIRECAEAAGVALSPINAERTPQQQEGFRVISLKVSVSGRMATISRMLWYLESTTVPLRISDLEITSRPENSDEMKMDLTISTLASPAEKTAGGSNAVALGGRR
jgi:hypothetical protein